VHEFAAVTGRVLLAACVTFSAAAGEERERPFPRSSLAFRASTWDWERQEGLEFVDPSRVVVGWGVDPVWYPKLFAPTPQGDYFRTAVGRAIEGGAILPTNVDLITATAREYSQRPELLEGRCLDFAGRPVVVPWFAQMNDGGGRAWWSCTNHSAYREHVRERVRRGFELRANALHVDDISGSGNVFGFGGCFCDRCLEGFTRYLRERFTPEQLARRGIDDLDAFDYGAVVRERVRSMEELRRAYWWEHECPLVQEYARYSSRRAAAFVAELGAYARELGGPDTLLCTNAWSLDPMYTSFYEVGDYFGAEVNHLSADARGTGLGDSDPSSMLVDERRALLAYRIADALGRPLCVTLPGGNYGYLRETNALNLLRRWEALAYASGHHFMHSAGGWIEDGRFEAPPEVVAWVFRFVDSHRELFDGYEAIRQVGLLYDLGRERYRWQSPVHAMVQELANANLPFGVIIGWDDWADRRLAPVDGNGYELIVVPDPGRLNAQCGDAVQGWLSEGRAVPWSGVDDVRSRIEPLVTLPETRAVWVLPRVRLGERAAPLVVHLLNRNYDLATDTIAPQEDVVVSLDARLLDGRRVTEATAFSPGAEALPLDYTSVTGNIVLRVPQLGIWSVVRVAWQPGEGLPGS
jgi:hypothetical protein